MLTTRIKADPWNKGEPHWTVSVQAAPSLVMALGLLRGLGGIVASAGGLRSRTAKVTAGRARYSTHYFGEAIDLHTASRTGPCRVQYDPAARRHTVWLITPGQPDDDLHDSKSELWTRWKKGKDGAWRREEIRETVVVAAESLTQIMADFGWTGIPARGNKAGECVCPEDWHYQRNAAFRYGMTFLDACVEMIGLTEKETLAWRPKAREVKWTGRAFA